ncbi:MAG: ATP-grasp domain-containing protein, partial [Anaerolineae bacterium]|nr:ATP-grasp domain-containing protein [Anaerolineae bacterium]
DEDGNWPVETATQAEVSQFVVGLLQDQTVDLPPAFVLDVGLINGRGWAVVEANPAWASGIYGCTPVDILPVLKRACVQQTNLSAEDACWIFERSE